MSGVVVWFGYLVLSIASLIASIYMAHQGDIAMTIAFVGAMWWFSNRSNSVEQL